MIDVRLRWGCGRHGRVRRRRLCHGAAQRGAGAARRGRVGAAGVGGVRGAPRHPAHLRLARRDAARPRDRGGLGRLAEPPARRARAHGPRRGQARPGRKAAGDDRRRRPRSGRSGQWSGAAAGGRLSGPLSPGHGRDAPPDSRGGAWRYRPHPGELADAVRRLAGRLAAAAGNVRRLGDHGHRHAHAGRRALADRVPGRRGCLAAGSAPSIGRSTWKIWP